jgi:hypothetical protein
MLNYKETLYLYCPVYKKNSIGIFCYQIFQDIFTKLYYVQSKDNLILDEKDR